MSVLFFRNSDTLQHQHQGAPRGANVDGLIGGVENEHGRLHRQTSVLLRNSNAGRSQCARHVVRTGMTMRKVVSRHGPYPATAPARTVAFPSCSNLPSGAM